MGFILRTLKKGFFWRYPRTSWQWDVLCVLILVFIFLTPKSWFENKGFQRDLMSQNSQQQVILLDGDLAGTQPDTREIERRVRLITGRADAEVLAVHPRRDANGNVIGYEVDIR
jgi:hypothetical protein